MTAFRVPVTMLAAPALSSQSLAYDLNDHLALTTDIQYMKDVVDENGAKGWIFKLRAVSERPGDPG